MNPRRASSEGTGPAARFRERGGFWVISQWVLMLGTLATGPLGASSWRNSWSLPLALVLLAAGACFGLGGVARLGAARTIFPEPKPGAGLVQGGVYRVVRHPLYTSVILLSLAWALGWQSMPSLALAAASAVFLDAKARSEERRLSRRFPDYDDYARRTRRLLPWIY